MDAAAAEEKQRRRIGESGRDAARRRIAGRIAEKEEDDESIEITKFVIQCAAAVLECITFTCTGRLPVMPPRPGHSVLALSASTCSFPAALAALAALILAGRPFICS